MKMPGEIQLVKDVDLVAEFDVVASKRRSAPCTTSTTSSMSRVLLSSVAPSEANSVMSKRSRQDACAYTCTVFLLPPNLIFNSFLTTFVVLKSQDNKKKHKRSSIQDLYNAKSDDDDGEEEVVNILSDILNATTDTSSPLSFLPDLVRNR
ncbi:hypothetical protein BDR07DRAFT_1394392 [Suillus spraguei]|nr:hypothetical protein BDR07DRAFT_1394392 [Suillus spraguei]